MKDKGKKSQPPPTAQVNNNVSKTGLTQEKVQPAKAITTMSGARLAILRRSSINVATEEGEKEVACWMTEKLRNKNSEIARKW